MRRQLFLMCLLLSLLTLAVYWQVGDHKFINLDDTQYITKNQHVQQGLASESITWAFSITDISYWHPLTWLSLMLDYELYGTNPRGYHLTNVALHILNVLFLFLILKWLTGSLWRSAFVAALFALHPLNVESVAWAVERKNVLSTFFWLLTLLAYSNYSMLPTLSRYLLLVLFFGLGLMTKPMLVTLPCVLLLLDYWPLGRLDFGQSKDSRSVQLRASSLSGSLRMLPHVVILEKVPLFILSGVAAYMTSLSAQRIGTTISTEFVPIKLRIAHGLVSYLSYGAKMVWPQNLAVFYPYPHDVPVWQSAGAAALLIGISLLVFRWARKAPYLVTGWLWYLGTLLPVIGLKQMGLWPAMADRFAYVPLIGLFIMIAWGIPELLARYPFKRIVLPLAAAGISVSLMLVSCLQVRYWRNSVLLYEHALAVTENNYLAHNNLGTVLEKIGKLDEATVHYAEAVRIKPDYAVAHNNLGEIKARQGMVKEAMSHYYQALKSKPDYAKPYNNLGIELAKQGKLQEAVFYLSQAIEIEPSYADGHCNLGAVLVRQGKIEEAITHFSEALRIDPNFARAYNNLGEAFFRRGELHKAAFHFSQALEIEPSYVDGHCNLGAVLARQGKMDEAITHFSEALRLNPSSVAALNNMGVTLAHQGKFQAAMDYFSRALQLEPDNLRTRQNMNRVLEEEARRDVAHE